MLMVERHAASAAPVPTLHKPIPRADARGRCGGALRLEPNNGVSRVSFRRIPWRMIDYTEPFAVRLVPSDLGHQGGIGSKSRGRWAPGCREWYSGYGCEPYTVVLTA